MTKFCCFVALIFDGKYVDAAFYAANSPQEAHAKSRKYIYPDLKYKVGSEIIKVWGMEEDLWGWDRYKDYLEMMECIDKKGLDGALDDIDTFVRSIER